MQNGTTAFIHAAKNGSVKLVDLLLRHGARIQHQDKVIRGKEAERVRFRFELICWNTMSDSGGGRICCQINA